MGLCDCYAAVFGLGMEWDRARGVAESGARYGPGMWLGMGQKLGMSI